MSTAEKKNAYKIRTQINQAIFKELIEQQGGDVFKHTAIACADRPMLSSISSMATNAIMRESRLNVVLKRQG